MGRSEHFVQFYESDEFIMNSVAEYVVHGLKSGEANIVLASREKLAGIREGVEMLSVGLGDASLKGKYIALDAHKTLNRFTVDGMPDAELFSDVIGDVVTRASKISRELCIFSEMIAILCGEKRFDAAVRLEELWNGFRKKHELSVFCACPIGAFKDRLDAERMAQVCNAHCYVIPGESYTSITGTAERLRKIALLQQRAIELETEFAAVATGDAGIK